MSNGVTQEPRTWRMQDHQGWGNRIGWFNWEHQRISGHTTPHPSVGDIVLSRMQSGKVASFRIVKMDPCWDPPDMWFATVEFVGYAETQGGE